MTSGVAIVVFGVTRIACSFARKVFGAIRIVLGATMMNCRWRRQYVFCAARIAFGAASMVLATLG